MASAQTKDAGLWSSVVVTRDWKDFSTTANMEWRANENISATASAFFEAKIQYKFNKYIRLSLGYRNGNKRNDDFSYVYRQRWNADLKLRRKFGDFSLDYRLRCQIGSEAPSVLEKLGPDGTTYRHKISASRKINKKWSAKIGVEGFAKPDLDNKFYWSDWRVGASADYRIKKRNYINFGYIVQSEIGGPNPLSEYIFTIGYKLELKKWKKAKKKDDEKKKD